MGATTVEIYNIVWPGPALGGVVSHSKIWKHKHLVSSQRYLIIIGKATHGGCSMPSYWHNILRKTIYLNSLWWILQFNKQSVKDHLAFRSFCGLPADHICLSTLGYATFSGIIMFQHDRETHTELILQKHCYWEKLDVVPTKSAASGDITFVFRTGLIKFIWMTTPLPFV